MTHHSTPFPLRFPSAHFFNPSLPVSGPFFFPFPYTCSLLPSLSFYAHSLPSPSLGLPLFILPLSRATGSGECRKLRHRGLRRSYLFWAASLLSDVERYAMRLFLGRQKVDVVRDQELACSDHAGAPVRNVLGRAEVRLPLRIEKLRTESNTTALFIIAISGIAPASGEAIERPVSCFSVARCWCSVSTPFCCTTDCH